MTINSPSSSISRPQITTMRRYWLWAIVSALGVFGIRFFSRELTFVSSRLPLLFSIASSGPSRGTLIVGVVGAILSLLIMLASTRRTTRLLALTQALKSTADSLTGEIAEHKETERRLGFASTIIENSQIVIANFRIIGSPDHPEPPVPEYISSNFDRYGYPAQDLLSGKIDLFRDVIHPQDQTRVLAAIAEAFARLNQRSSTNFGS